MLGCMDGLIKRFSSRKAKACKSATCVMISDAIVTSGMADNSRLVEVLNEVITCSMSFACSRDLLVRWKSVIRVEGCASSA